MCEEGADRKVDAAGLSAEDHEFLLRLARGAVETTAGGLRPAAPSDVPPGCLRPAACFVTLYEHGALRGCMGTTNPGEPLWQAVMECAVSAASRDPRFHPVAPSELARLDVHISVLGPLRALRFADTAGLFEQLEPGRHGVVLRAGQFAGLYLPQVWDAFKNARDVKTAFLTSLSQKAGDGSGTLWQRPEVEASVFEAVEFGETDEP